MRRRKRPRWRTTRWHGWLSEGCQCTHTPLAAVYLELGLPEPGGVWAREVLRLWRKVALLPRGRLPREAWEHARSQGTANAFVARVRAAHSMLLGREVPASGPAAGLTARDAEKKAIVAALRRIAKERWTAHVRDKEAEGAGFYSGAPVPGASGGFRAHVPPRGCDHTGRRMLVAHRLHGHYLQACVGGLHGLWRPMEQRACPRCALEWGGQGPAPVEDEAHYWAECPSLRPARERMLSELGGAYPGFRQRWAPLSRLDRARALAFGVPDGTWAPGASRAVWARGVRAVVQFGVDSALLCPVLGQAMWRLGR